MAINTTRITDLLQKKAPQFLADATVRAGEFYGSIPKLPPSDPKGCRWRMKTAKSNGAANFAEHGTFPVEDEYEDAEAFLAWGSFVRTIRMSGLSQDQLKMGATFIANYFETETKEAIDDIVEKINTQSLGGANTNGITGITVIGADTGNYAGLDRSTVTAAQAYVNDVSGALTVAALADAADTLVDTRRGRFDRIYGSTDQVEALTALASGDGVPSLSLQGSSKGDQTMQTKLIGYGDANNYLVPRCYFRNVPVYAMPGWATDRLDLIDSTQLAYEVIRDLNVSQPRYVNDDTVWAITYILQLRHRNPYKGWAVVDNLS